MARRIQQAGRHQLQQHSWSFHAPRTPGHLHARHSPPARPSVILPLRRNFLVSSGKSASGLSLPSEITINRKRQGDARKSPCRSRATCMTASGMRIDRGVINKETATGLMTGKPASTFLGNNSAAGRFSTLPAMWFLSGRYSCRSPTPRLPNHCPKKPATPKKTDALVQHHACRGGVFRNASRNRMPSNRSITAGTVASELTRPCRKKARMVAKNTSFSAAAGNISKR